MFARAYLVIAVGPLYKMSSRIGGLLYSAMTRGALIYAFAMLGSPVLVQTTKQRERIV